MNDTEVGGVLPPFFCHRRDVCEEMHEPDVGNVDMRLLKHAIENDNHA